MHLKKSKEICCHGSLIINTRSIFIAIAIHIFSPAVNEEQHEVPPFRSFLESKTHTRILIKVPKLSRTHICHDLLSRLIHRIYISLMAYRCSSDWSYPLHLFLQSNLCVSSHFSNLHNSHFLVCTVVKQLQSRFYITVDNSVPGISTFVAEFLITVVSRTGSACFV